MTSRKTTLTIVPSSNTLDAGLCEIHDNHDQPPLSSGKLASGDDHCHSLLQRLEAKLNHIIEMLRKPDAGSKSLVSVKVAALKLGISERKVREQLYAGRWRGYRVGRAIRVDPEELREDMRRKFNP